MFAHGVEFSDVGSSQEEGLDGSALVVQGDAGDRGWEEGRGAAREEDQHEVFVVYVTQGTQPDPGGELAASVGERVSGLEVVERRAGAGVAGRGNDQTTGDAIAKQREDGVGHAGSGLSGGHEPDTGMGVNGPEQAFAPASQHGQAVALATHGFRYQRFRATGSKSGGENLPQPGVELFSPGVWDAWGSGPGRLGRWAKSVDHRVCHLPPAEHWGNSPMDSGSCPRSEPLL